MSGTKPLALFIGHGLPCYLLYLKAVFKHTTRLSSDNVRLYQEFKSGGRLMVGGRRTSGINYPSQYRSFLRSRSLVCSLSPYNPYLTILNLLSPSLDAVIGVASLILRLQVLGSHLNPNALGHLNIRALFIAAAFCVAYHVFEVFSSV